MQPPCRPQSPPRDPLHRVSRCRKKVCVGGDPQAPNHTGHCHWPEPLCSPPDAGAGVGPGQVEETWACEHQCSSVWVSGLSTPQSSVRTASHLLGTVTLSFCPRGSPARVPHWPNPTESQGAGDPVATHKGQPRAKGRVRKVGSGRGRVMGDAQQA